MSNPYIGEIRLFAGNFGPLGWMLCQGQLLPISEYEALFQLIGTTYGGDGQETFALPDLQGRVSVHQGDGFVMGQAAGSEAVTLTTNQIPVHSHPTVASSAPGFANRPTGQTPAASPSVDLYSDTGATGSLAPGSVTSTGGNQPHDNMQPYLAVNHIISLYGIFPSQT